MSFAYEPQNPVLKGVSLTVPSGKTVALVGPSGSGKSTLVNLALRFFDPERGRVTIDGQDIKHTTIESLRDSIALVTQDPVLFDDTIRANIAYGSKPVVEEQVIAAAKAAAAHDFITGLPKGYDTRVGEAGGLLSGGERQRIAFARAIYKDAPILLLDEPTSSLEFGGRGEGADCARGADARPYGADDRAPPVDCEEGRRDLRARSGPHRRGWTP